MPQRTRTRPRLHVVDVRLASGETGTVIVRRATKRELRKSAETFGRPLWHATALLIEAAIVSSTLSVELTEANLHQVLEHKSLLALKDAVLPPAPKARELRLPEPRNGQEALAQLRLYDEEGKRASREYLRRLGVDERVCPAVVARGPSRAPGRRGRARARSPGSPGRSRPDDDPDADPLDPHRRGA